MSSSPEEIAFITHHLNSLAVTPTASGVPETVPGVHRNSGNNVKARRRRRNVPRTEGGEAKVPEDDLRQNEKLQKSQEPRKNQSVKINQARKQGRKPKNTTDFKPRFNRPDLHVKICSGKKEKNEREFTVHDVVLVPELFGPEESLQVYDDLCQEVVETENKSKLMTLWHGDSHEIANDKVQGGKWKERSPTFQKVIARIESYFGMKINATRFNLYRENSQDWKPYHHDRAAFTPGTPQNFTVSASFGQHREIGFEHARTRRHVFVDAPNNSAYGFARDVNIEWKHGVVPVEPDTVVNGRISIICWGEVPLITKGSRVTENEVPTAKDLGIE